MRILILDDDQFRHDWFTLNYPGAIHTYTTDQAIWELDRQVFDIAFLDHDLNQFGNPTQYGDKEEFTGQHVSRYIVTIPWIQRPKRVIIHSVNPAGAGRMHSDLIDKVDEVAIVPFHILMKL